MLQSLLHQKLQLPVIQLLSLSRYLIESEEVSPHETLISFDNKRELAKDEIERRLIELIKQEGNFVSPGDEF